MKVNKLLRGLMQPWENIKISIRETQRIMPLSVNELIGTLQSYKIEKPNEENESKGKKSIMLKSNIDSNDANTDEDSDEELALIIKKFKKMKKKGKMLKGKKFNEKKKICDEAEVAKDVICFHCKKRGHIKTNCPLLKKKNGKYEKVKKALKVEIWSDIECEDSDEEYANICLMTKLDSDSF